MDKISIKINMFAMQQVIFCPDMKQIMTTTDELAELIPKMCRQYDVYDVEFLGNKSYLTKVIKDIKQTELAEYGINKINFIERD